MCRLYGMSGNQPSQVECSLIDAQNSLILQSVQDARGVANADGWGIGIYEQGVPRVFKSAQAASHDTEFRTAASEVTSRTTLAHVRAATVGDNGLDNTHPFHHGPWMFAHNGTLTGVTGLRPELEAEIPEHLLRQLRGETDSELMFFWMLAQMPEHGLDPLSGADSADDLVALLATLIPELDRRNARHTTEPALLNVLLTDGVHLAAARWGNTLHLTERSGWTDCDVCHTSHTPVVGHGNHRAVVVASEPITRESWVEIPDRSFIAVTNGHLVGSRAIEAA